MNKNVSKIACNHIFFFKYQSYILYLFLGFILVFPSFISFFRSRIFVEEIIFEEIIFFQKITIQNILISMIFYCVIIISLTIYKWGTNIQSGSYGYWLLLDVDRKYFIMYSSIKIIGVLFGVISFSILMLIIGNNFYFSLDQYLSLISIIILQLSTLVFSAFILIDIFKKPEVSTGLFLIIFLLSLSIFTLEYNEIVGVILLPMNFWMAEVSFIHYLLSFVYNLLLLYVMTKIHTKNDVNL